MKILFILRISFDIGAQERRPIFVDWGASHLNAEHNVGQEGG
jgi:hypothetical protein